MYFKKSVVLGVSGGIAVYKSLEIVSALTKLGIEVDVIMTDNSREFVTPLSFETLSKRKVITSTFEHEREFEIEHIFLAKKAGVFVIAPATANVIGKLAAGVADDMLTTTVMATHAPVLICPAMNEGMYNSDAVKENIKILKERGFLFEGPDCGFLACGDLGVGRMSEPKAILERILSILYPKSDYLGKNVLITAGATEEPIDRVRVITNHSSGKMGVALAEAAMDRGAKVTMIVGKTSVPLPLGAEIINVKTTEDMYKAVMASLCDKDIIIKAAAPADYKVKNCSDKKIKAESLTLELIKTVDIASEVGRVKGDKKLVVFAAETEELIAHATEKLFKKNADLIVANDVTAEGAGFNSDTNIATLIKKDGKQINCPLISKRELADIILDNVL